MIHHSSSLSVGTGIILALVSSVASADSEELRNYAKVAFAYVAPNNSSGELSGPYTPPGIKAEADNTTSIGLIYGRELAKDWTLELAAGIPPTVKVYGAGTAAPLGEVGSAKVWYPALVVSYAFSDLSPHFKPYIGAGINYTWFTKEKISPAYNAAVQGTSTTGSLSSSVGPVLKLGVEIPINRNWFVDIVAQRYWIKTTATITTETPGLGPVERKLDLKVDPSLFAIAVAYRF